MVQEENGEGKCCTLWGIPLQCCLVGGLDRLCKLEGKVFAAYSPLLSDFFFDTSIMKPCQDLSSQAPVAPFPYICKHYSCKSPAFQICMRMKISSEISNRHMQCFGLGWFAFPHQGPA
jgi:hypothetical protein